MKVKLFLQTKDGANATAEYDTVTKECVVKKGSVVTGTISEAPSFKGAKSIRKNRDKYVKSRKVTEDVYFKSSSTAGNFVTGRSTDGMHAWKDEKGTALKDIVG